MKGSLSLLGLALSVGILIPAFQLKDGPSHYKVLPPALQGNLTVFPVVSATTFDTALTKEFALAKSLLPRPAKPQVWCARASG